MSGRPGRIASGVDALPRGALAGIGATVVMTAVILLGRRLGLLHTPPPETVTRNVTRLIGVGPPRRRPARGIAWALAHGAYGAGCGALFAGIRSRLPGSPWLAGLIFGEAVWAVSYLGYLPVADLYPEVEEDRRSRTVVMIAAHAVYGAALALAYDGWTRASTDS